MNKRGQVVIYTLMLAVVIIILGLALIPSLNESNQNARADTTDTQIGLNCSNPNLDDYYKGTCLIQDLTMPYFIGGVIGIAGLVIGAKIIYG